MSASPVPATTPKVIGRRLERETRLEPASTLPENWFSTFAAPEKQDATPSVSVQSNGVSRTLPLAKSSSSLMNKPTKVHVTKQRRPQNLDVPSAVPPPQSSAHASVESTVPQDEVMTSHASTEERNPLHSRHHLKGLDTDELLSINVRVDAKKAPHIPGFYGNPRTERTRAAGAVASAATQQRLTIDRERIASNLIITSHSDSIGAGGKAASADVAHRVAELGGAAGPYGASVLISATNSPDTAAGDALFVAIGSGRPGGARRAAPANPRRLAWSTDVSLLLERAERQAEDEMQQESLRLPPKPRVPHLQAAAASAPLGNDEEAEDRQCAVCLEGPEDGNSEVLVKPCPTCHVSVHRGCACDWRVQCRQAGKSPTCIACRSSWD